jgi:8-oxo-dGTP diphosphatase
VSARLFVVRHGHAGSRADWDGPDHLRPLSGRGRRQAEFIADLIEPERPARIVSSPSVRCTQTVLPLATRCGIRLEEDDRLAEGSLPVATSALVAELLQPSGDPGIAVVCSHGDVIPAFLHTLTGAEGLDPWLCAKGSVWILDFDAGGRCERGAYRKGD